MNESVAITKETDAKKGFSSTRNSDEGIHHLREEPGQQLSSLGDVMGNSKT